MQSSCCMHQNSSCSAGTERSLFMQLQNKSGLETRRFQHWTKGEWFLFQQADQLRLCTVACVKCNTLIQKDLNMHFVWPLVRNHAGILNSCFTGVLEQEMLKMLSELGPDHTVRGKREEEAENWKEKKRISGQKFVHTYFHMQTKRVPLMSE